MPLGVTYSRNERHDLEAKVERDAVTVASLSEGLLEGKGETSAASLRAVADRYQRDTGGRVVVVDRRGNARRRHAPDPGRHELREPAGDRLRRSAARVATGVRHSNTLGTDLLYVAVPVASAGKILGAARITYPTSAVDRRVRRYWLTLAAIAAIVLAGVTLVGLWLARGVSRPLRRVEEAAAEIGAGHLEARAPEEGPPEVRRLARELNETAAKLQALLESQQAFVADASHELRTPLTALRLRLENLGEPAGPALAEVDRLGRLVEGLLALARADAAWRSGPVDVDAVLADRLGAAAEVTPGRRRAACAVRSSPERLGQIVDNLVANALAVSRAASRRGRARRRLGRAARRRPRPGAHGRGARARVRPLLARPLARVRLRARPRDRPPPRRADGGEAELREAPGGGHRRGRPAAGPILGTE